MAKIDLTKYGITGTTEIVYNPSYELLYEEETKAGLEGYEIGRESELGAIDVTSVQFGIPLMLRAMAMPPHIPSGWNQRSLPTNISTTRFISLTGISSSARSIGTISETSMLPHAA